MPERIIKIDAEIWEAEQKLNETLSFEKYQIIKAKISELKRRREEIFAELEKKKAQE